MKFLNLVAQYRSIKKGVDSAVKKVLKDGVYIGGQEVVKFEDEIAKFCSTKCAISVNSGTDALFLALKALGVGRGDEVITTPFTFIATAEVIANLGAKPVFVDINPQTFNIDSLKIEAKITKKTKAILPVHLFGQMADMEKIMKIARKHKLYVIEDAAQAIGAKIKFPGPESKVKMAGAVGDCGCFSFFPAKNLGAFGDGGMLTINNKKTEKLIRLLKNHGSSPKEKYLNLVLGVNSRLDTIQAAALRIKLKHLNKWNKKRAENAVYYRQGLNGVGDIITPFSPIGFVSVFHQYTIRTKFRDKLQTHLKEKDIPTMIYYSLPLHLQPAFKYLGLKKGDFPESERAAKEVLSLPVDPELSKKELDYIIAAIKNFYK